VSAGHVLVIDQGTTSSRAIVFDGAVRPVASAQQEFPQHYPAPGWVEHDPEDIWTTALACARRALEESGLGADAIAAIGIANQRETTLVWDRATGRPIHNAIVWQDRRTADICDTLRQQGHERLVSERTGLRLDPYFAATKIGWILEHVPEARARAEAGLLAFGTVDTWLLWRLTEGAVHATDATNASRTLLYDINRGVWDEEMLALFGVPASMLPEVRDSAGLFGHTAAGLFDAPLPIRGMAGDQQAALIGQACFQPGMVKATYGTGCFALLTLGDQPVRSAHALLTTIAYQFHGRRAFALEGSIFSAGAAVQWLRDGLGIVRTAAETGELAAQADPEQPVYMVPAFTGLGAPHWDSQARGTLTGITRGTTRKEIARAVLESVACQTRDLVAAMEADAAALAEPITAGILRVDGGMAASDWTMQAIADMLDRQVDRPANLETTAMGAAYLAGLDAGLYPPPEEFAGQWAAEHSFHPAMAEAARQARYAGWRDAVARARLRPDRAMMDW
jgi:glycerol kinase